VEDAMGEMIDEFPRQSTRDERIIVGLDVGVLIWQPCTIAPLGFDFKDKTLASWCTIPQKKSCCALASWKRPLQNNNTCSYFETKNSRCHIKINHFKTNNVRSHLNTDPSNQQAF
jgi:hypothetical protein